MRNTRRVMGTFGGRYLPTRMSTEMSRTLGGNLRTYFSGKEWTEDDKVSAVPEEIFEEIERNGGRFGRPGPGGGLWVGPWSQIKGCTTQADFERTLGVMWKKGLKRVYVVKLVEPHAHHTTQPSGKEQGTNELFGKTATKEEFVHGQIPKYTGYMPSSQEGIEYFLNVEVREVSLE